MIFQCPSCNFVIDVSYPKIIHAGFSDCGFLYCDKSGDLVTWSSYDKTYQSLVPNKHPWDLNAKEKAIIESNLVACPCGGKFPFAAKPRCPRCNHEIPSIVDNIHWIDWKNRLDGERRNIWKTVKLEVS